MKKWCEISVVTLILSTLVGCNPTSPTRTAMELDGAGETPPKAATLPPTWTPDALTQPGTTTPEEESLANPTRTSQPTLAQNEAELSRAGPWILIGSREGGRILKDIDGDSFRRFDEPGTTLISPRGKTVAAISFDKIVFSELPSLETLLEFHYPKGQTASGMIGNYFFWSPNGVYFAFLESINDSVSDEVFRAHLYRRDENRVETLDANFEIDGFVGWSPDSRYLLVRGKSAAGGDGIWAANIEDGSTHLVDGSMNDVGQYAIGELTGWISDTVFVDWQNFSRMEGGQSACDRYLRRVDLHRGVLENLVGPAAIMPPALDPGTGVIFFGIVPIECDHPLEPGLYRYDTKQKQATRIEAWESVFDLVPEWPIQWSSELGQFIVEASFPSSRMGFFTPLGDLLFIIEGAFIVNPAPDGRWALVHTQDGDRLIDRTGAIVGEFPAGDYDGGVWLPDSSGLFLISDQGVALLKAESGWQQEWIPGAESIEAVIAPGEG